MIERLERLRIDLWYLDDELLIKAAETPDAAMIEIRFGEGEGPGEEPMPLPKNAPKNWRMS